MNYQNQYNRPKYTIADASDLDLPAVWRVLRRGAAEVLPAPEAALRAAPRHHHREPRAAAGARSGHRQGTATLDIKRHTDPTPLRSCHYNSNNNNKYKNGSTSVSRISRNKV